jgi:choline dehydrogenase
VQPTSRGAVRLASNNSRDAAVIDGNYLGTDHDFAAVVRAISLWWSMSRKQTN